MRNLTGRFSHGGNIYQAKKLSPNQNIIDFSANINLLGLNKEIKNHIFKEYSQILNYPDPQAKNLTSKIARYWKINKANILLGNGSIELIYLIINTFRPKNVSFPVPTFSEYERAAMSISSKIKTIKLNEQNNFITSIKHIPQADISFICNPNNPTGNLLINKSDFKNLPAKLSVIDETFMDFVKNELELTSIYEAVKNKKIIALRSFTKFFALPGLRLGYIIAHKEIINKLKLHLPPWNINIFAQIAGEIVLTDKEYIKKSREITIKEKDLLSNKISQIKALKNYPSEANFLLIKIIKSPINADTLAKKLLKKGTLIRSCANFQNLNNKFFRIAVRNREENNTLIKYLKQIL